MIETPSVQLTTPEIRPKCRRIVLTAVSSLGDLHSDIAIALGLKARGHEPILATSPCYRTKVEALGLGFQAGTPARFPKRVFLLRRREDRGRMGRPDSFD